jgi:phosphatidate phosphatase APP1
VREAAIARDLLRAVRHAVVPGLAGPRHLRITPYTAHGSESGVVVRGRVVDGEAPPEAVAGEGTRAAVNRTISRFTVVGLESVPVRVRVGGVEGTATTDGDGHFVVELLPEPGALRAPWAEGWVELAEEYRGVRERHRATFRVLVPDADVRAGVISDVDDTIVVTGAQRALRMVLSTLTGSYLTRRPMAGAAELYRDLAGAEPGRRPFFYVSSSPWPLYDFLVAFLDHRDFPPGPLLLRAVSGAGRDAGSHTSHKRAMIAEIIRTHPAHSFVLIGDSGQHDPQIYAAAVRAEPDRFRAVYIREVRRDPTDRRVESVLEDWHEDVPFVLVADSAQIAHDAAARGLL